MSLLSNVSAAVKDIRLVPLSGEHSSSTNTKDCDKASQTQPSSTHHKCVLSIQSYNRIVPPDPRPDLEFDCRATRNPAQESRRSYTGMDDELKDELMGRVEFSDLLSHAETEIRKMVEVREARTKNEDENVVVRVGCLCGSGHHRSPALAELLGEIDWPEEWEVQVHHRDLSEKVKTKKSNYLKEARKSNQKLDRPSKQDE